ncbi:MAG: chloride channel protein [Verrucomicrobiia bacterium]
MKSVVSIFEKLKTVAVSYIRKHLQTFFEIRRKLVIREEVVHLGLAVVVGIIGGFSNLLFHEGENLLKLLLYRREGEIGWIAADLEWWQRIMMPAAGALAAGLVLMIGIRFIRRDLPSSILEAVVVGQGRLPFRSGLIKTLSSLISLTTGASIGREGSIVHLSATAASKFGQLFDYHPYKLRLLTACGAAAGIAAAFNAPLTGAVFAAQIVIGNFSMTMFTPIILSSVVAAMTSRSFFGINPLYRVPSFDFTSLTQLPWIGFVGLGSGIIGALFLKGIDLMEKYFKSAIKQSYIRITTGGVIVGAISIFYPYIWGNGYGPVNMVLDGKYTVELLLGLLLAKAVATMISVGSGMVGGIMTPTLFLGAAYGSFCGLGLHALNFAQNLPVCVFALAGMASVFAATTHSPLMAILMVFEISLNYSLMPALMLACPLATLVAKRFHRDSVYTKPLHERGVHIEESKKFGAADTNYVADIMRKPVPPILNTTPFEKIIERFLSSPNNFLPVVDSDSRLIGIVSLQDVKEFLNQNENMLGVIAYDVMRPPQYFLTPQQTLQDAFPVLINSEMRNIPVVDTPKNMKLIGSVLRSEALGIISEKIAATPR